MADPARRAGTEHALYSQASYLFYVLAWGYLFRERVPNPDKPGSLLRRWRLTSWQWAAVGVLLVAVCLAQAREGVSVEVRDTARYPWWGVPLLIAQTLLLALSGAFTEVRGGGGPGTWDEAGGPDESRPCFPARSTCTRSSYLWVRGCGGGEDPFRTPCAPSFLTRTLLALPPPLRRHGLEPAEYVPVQLHGGVRRGSGGGSSRPGLVASRGRCLAARIRRPSHSAGAGPLRLPGSAHGAGAEAAK